MNGYLKYCKILNRLTSCNVFTMLITLLSILWHNGTNLELLAMFEIKPPPNTISQVLTTTPTKGAPSGPLYLYGEQK
jgi:hypothetical protein